MPGVAPAPGWRSDLQAVESQPPLLAPHRWAELWPLLPGRLSLFRRRPSHPLSVSSRSYSCPFTAANDHPLFILVACLVSSELLLLTFLCFSSSRQTVWVEAVQFTRLAMEGNLESVFEVGFLIVLFFLPYELLNSSQVACVCVGGVV